MHLSPSPLPPVSLLPPAAPFCRSCVQADAVATGRLRLDLSGPAVVAPHLWEPGSCILMLRPEEIVLSYFLRSDF